MISDVLSEALDGMDAYDVPAFYGMAEAAMIDALRVHMRAVLSYLDTPPLTASSIVREEGWQPIETAPKDVAVLVWGEALRWRGMSGVTYGYVLSDFNGRRDIVSLDGIAGPKVRQIEATHWRPLPAPPAALHPTTKGAENVG